VTSPWYTAPEIIRREGANIAADYWSLGVLLYECVFRKYPFGRASQSPYEVYNAVLIGEYEFPELIDQELRQVEEVIDLLLVPNPAKRLPGGLKTLKQHSWFRGLDWVTATQQELLNKKVAAPIKPKIKSFDEKIAKISKQQTALHEAIGVRNIQVALKVPSMLDS
jgi:serine/threonine protein kinase